MNKTALMLLLIAAGSIAAIQTKAQTKTPCGPKEVVYDRLLNEYGERPIVMGMRDSQGVFAFWMNEETGTWTIVLVRADNIVCVPVAGENAVRLPEFLPKGDDT